MIVYLKSINPGYKRLWLVLSIIWLVFSSYYDGYRSYINRSSEEIEYCSPGNGMLNPWGKYKSKSEIPFKIYSICNIKEVNSGSGIYKYTYYLLDGPRPVTIGALLKILTPPFLVPLMGLGIYLIYYWIKSGFVQKNDNV